METSYFWQRCRRLCFFRIWLLSTLFLRCESACARFVTNDTATVPPDNDVRLTFSITKSCPANVTVSKVWVIDESVDPPHTLCIMLHTNGACNRNYAYCTCSTRPGEHAYSVTKHVQASHALVLNGQVSNGEVFRQTVNIVVTDLPSSSKLSKELSTELSTQVTTHPDVTSPSMTSFNSKDASSQGPMTPSDGPESTVSDLMQAADELNPSTPFKISLEITIFIVFGVVVFIIVVVFSVLVGILFRKRGRSASIPEAPPAPHRFRPNSEGLAVILRRLQQQHQPNLRLQMPQNRLAVISYADNTYAQIPDSPERVEMELFQSMSRSSSLSSSLSFLSYEIGLVVSNDSSSSSAADSDQSDRASNMSDKSSVNWSDRSHPTLPQLPDDYLNPVSEITGNSASVAVTASGHPTQQTDDEQPYEFV